MCALHNSSERKAKVNQSVEGIEPSAACYLLSIRRQALYPLSYTDVNSVKLFVLPSLISLFNGIDCLSQTKAVETAINNTMSMSLFIVALV